MVIGCLECKHSLKVLGYGHICMRYEGSDLSDFTACDEFILKWWPSTKSMILKVLLKIGGNS